MIKPRKKRAISCIAILPLLLFDVREAYSTSPVLSSQWVKLLPFHQYTSQHGCGTILLEYPSSAKERNRLVKGCLLMTDYTGQQWGSYRLVRLLGSGGFADVYLGEHIHLGTQAALKILTTKLASEEISRFRDEARTIMQLEHPHIVRILDFGLENRIPFIVISYAPGGSLRQQHPRGTALALPLLINYVKQIASPLQHAHKQKLIHLYVKPANILIETNRKLLLIYFC